MLSNDFIFICMQGRTKPVFDKYSVFYFNIFLDLYSVWYKIVYVNLAICYSHFPLQAPKRALEFARNLQGVSVLGNGRELRMTSSFTGCLALSTWVDKDSSRVNMDLCGVSQKKNWNLGLGLSVSSGLTRVPGLRK